MITNHTMPSTLWRRVWKSSRWFGLS